MTCQDRSANKYVLIGIPCLLRGGTEMQTLLLTRALIELRYNVEVCCYFESDEIVAEEFKAVGAKVILLNWSRTMGFLKFIQSFTSIIREKQPDIIHIQYMAPGLLPIIAAKMARTPVILATVHYPGTPHGILAHKLLRFGALLTDRFTCVSEAAEKSWFGNSFILTPAVPSIIKSRKHFTIPNAVDIEKLERVTHEGSLHVLEIADNLKNKLIIGAVGRLSHEKGIDILIKAFAAVKKVVPDTYLLIVGEVNKAAQLKDLASQLKIGDAVIWAGKLAWQEAMGCLALMDVVIVPSRFEGFGLTAVEAMACEKPVIASRVDGLAEIINNGINGLLVDSEDVKGFAEAIICLLTDKEKSIKIGSAARKHVENNYSYPIFKERVRALYEVVRLKAEEFEKGSRFKVQEQHDEN